MTDEKANQYNIRKKIISQIEEQRDSYVISYITSTRLGYEVQMNIDIIRYVYDHLEQIKSAHAKKKIKGQPRIDLYIHSNGGDGTVPWRLVTLIREFTKHFGVIVPHRAFSAATLTALGANEIIMHPMGMLGPTDPSVTNQFNPINPTTGQPIPISVEDVTAYIQMIKEDVGINHEDELIQAFNILADKIHPLALGNVRRSISQSKMMASKLLNLHIGPKQEHKIAEIAENLTSKLFFHGHPVNRKEAREQIGLDTVIDPDENLEKKIWQLYMQYEDLLELNTPFNAPQDFQAKFPKLQPNQMMITDPKTNHLACIESIYGSDICSSTYRLSGYIDQNGLIQVRMLSLANGWTKGNVE